jgi:hypothetical protein
MCADRLLIFLWFNICKQETILLLYLIDNSIWAICLIFTHTIMYTLISHGSRIQVAQFFDEK